MESYVPFPPKLAVLLGPIAHIRSSDTLAVAGGHMHFHLPKPLHGWREFAGEVGIIVVGVLIALGAEQLVQWIHVRAEVGQVRAALKAELADDRARWEYMSAAEACTLRRLDAIDGWLPTAPSNARLPDAYPNILLNLHSSSWDVAKASPATAQMPLGERVTYSSLYAALENWRELLRNESTNNQAIEALLERANQPVNRAQIPVLLSRARILLRFRQASSAYITKRFDDLGVRPEASTLDGAVDPNELCKPLKTKVGFAAAV
jgi:hypothetical protein